jgi:uncharacterized membrane protein
MNKNRVEAFSDGVFSIVMTLLVFNIKIPEVSTISSNNDLWYALWQLWPIFATYYISFFVLSVFWINHHFFFHSFAKQVDRHLNLTNLIYLMFIAFVPFSAQLLGTFKAYQPAVLMYGINILVIITLTAFMLGHLKKHPELANPDISSRTRTQAKIRISLTMGCYILGIIASFWSLPVSIAFYTFPIVFNLIPGTLDAVEHMFGFCFN